MVDWVFFCIINFPANFIYFDKYINKLIIKKTDL